MSQLIQILHSPFWGAAIVTIILLNAGDYKWWLIGLFGLAFILNLKCVSPRRRWRKSWSPRTTALITCRTAPVWSEFHWKLGRHGRGDIRYPYRKTVQASSLNFEF